MDTKSKIFSCFFFSILNMISISCAKLEDFATPFPPSYATNINMFEAKSIETLTPLVFTGNPLLPSIVHNTGSSLFFSSMMSDLTYVTGGILGNKTYNFFQSEYFWDLDLKLDAGNKINGLGSPVQIIVTYYNAEYGDMETAATKKDGIAQFVIFVYVLPFPNPLFYPFEFMVQSVENANSSMIFWQFFAFDWFFLPSITQDYFILPGTYTNAEFAKKYKNPTVVFLVRFPLPYISYEQFKVTFSLLRNEAGKPFSNKLKMGPADQKSLLRATRVRLVLT